MELADLLPSLLGVAWLVPLASFGVILFAGPRLGKHGVLAGHVATGAILSSLVLSLISLGLWLTKTSGQHVEAPASLTTIGPGGGGAAHTVPPPETFSGDWYTLGEFGSLKMTIGYHIDALTVLMFAMVTLIASCIHFYATGYMHDELHDVTDHEVTLSDGHHLHRPGRFHRFFQYMSLFCFSMLGLVIAGNIAMVFVFWELVGICSYFLIGFYIERKSASNAANKAFIVNRIGDFGMIIGLMALWAGFGTFAFGGSDGMFAKARQEEHHYHLEPPAAMVRAAARSEVDAIYAEEYTRAFAGLDPQAAYQPAGAAAAKDASEQAEARIAAALPAWGEEFGYGLLVVAGLGIFCGCVGKSAQFPLHVWLPDAMEGPTPVSALVHSATMVAAGVYLVGRFYPLFTPEVLLVIGYVGAITLLLAASIAITATDIKRVLAYSTVSQLGYMMLALGAGGWQAGLFHLITHAFFKSLLFLGSGSVIHACHTNDMLKMGGLRHKMPWTAYTMLAGCLAIIGCVGFSGFFSKDAIVAQTLSFAAENKGHGTVFFLAAAGGAAVTAFYMFRLWYLTFAGEPRDHHIYEHAHESPKVMYVPLVILAVFAVGVGWTLPGGWGVQNLLEQARQPGELGAGHLWETVRYPDEHAAHDFHAQATLLATATALAGFLVATAFYGLRWLDPREVREQFRAVHRWLWNKWYFDELYQGLFVRPTHAVAGVVSRFDKQVIDGLLHRLTHWTRGLSRLDDLFDRYVIDGLVNLGAGWTWSAGKSLRKVQTGKLRQYVMLIVIATVALSIVISVAAAGG